MVGGGLGERSAGELAPAGREPVVQREPGRERAEDAGADVDDVVRAEDRGQPGALHDPGHRLALAFPAAPARPRTAQAVAADRGVDGGRAARADLVVADREPAGGARREVLKHDVGLVDQPPVHLLAAERGEVEEQRLLAPVEVPGGTVAGAADLHDLRAELAEEPAAGRAGQRQAQVKHAEPAQRLGEARFGSGGLRTWRQPLELGEDLGGVRPGGPARPRLRVGEVAQPDRDARAPDVAELGVGHLGDRVRAAGVFGADPLRRGPDEADGRARGVAEFLPFRGGAGQELLAEPRVEPLVDVRVRVGRQVEELGVEAPEEAGGPGEPGQVPRA